MKRAAYLQRHAPLERGGPIRRKSPRRIAKETPEESLYKAWLHIRPCVVTGSVGELVQASHVGKGGMGQKKGSWKEAVPMLAEIHRQWGERSGLFRGWSQDDRDEAAQEWIARTQAAWESTKAREGDAF